MTTTIAIHIVAFSSQGPHGVTEGGITLLCVSLLLTFLREVVELNYSINKLMWSCNVPRFLWIE